VVRGTVGARVCVSGAGLPVGNGTKTGVTTPLVVVVFLSTSELFEVLGGGTGLLVVLDVDCPWVELGMEVSDWIVGDTMDTGGAVLGIVDDEDTGEAVVKIVDEGNTDTGMFTGVVRDSRVSDP
jgi:hypothetical protein